MAEKISTSCRGANQMNTLSEVGASVVVCSKSEEMRYTKCGNCNQRYVRPHEEEAKYIVCSNCEVTIKIQKRWYDDSL